MKILIIDTLIQTVNLDNPVRSGLVKSAFLDAKALAERHDVSYMYSGNPSNKFKFNTVIVDKIGAKDWCVSNNKKPTMSHYKLNKDIKIIINKIAEINPEAIFIHVYSKSRYLFKICEKFPNIPKIFVFHDCATNNDLIVTGRIVEAIMKLQKYNAFITTNSEYTKDSIESVMNAREDDMRKYFNLIPTIKDFKTFKIFDAIYDYFVYYDNKIIPDIVDNGGFSVNIGRYDKQKGIFNLLQLHKRNNHKLKLYGIKDPVFDVGLVNYNKIKNLSDTYNNYEMCENYSDKKLREDAKYGNNIIISCPTEGFGYTAFEMGCFGIPSIILKKGKRHATEEYLSKVGAKFKSINMLESGWKNKLYDLMPTYKLSKQEKLLNANKFLNYFNIENYINEREKFIKLATIKLNKNINKNQLF